MQILLDVQSPECSFPFRYIRNKLGFETEIYVGWDSRASYVAVICLPSFSKE
jgi:hypothetical protein